MPIDVSKYKDDFINETKDLISSLNTSLLSLEKTPSDAKVKNDVYRAMHTIKGMAATMGFQEISTVCHEMENLIGRNDSTIVTSDAISVVFEGVDLIEKFLQIYKENKEDKINIGPLINKLKTVASQSKTSQQIAPTVSANVKPEDVEKDLKSVSKIDAIRVDKEFLDEIVNMSGEIFINVEQLHNITSKFTSAELFEIVENIRILSGKLKEQTLKARLVPLETVFNRFPRMVRDLSKDYNKDINFVVEGGHIGIDRIILEGISEVFVHIIRNAIAHGIEPISIREKKGKNKTGTLKVSAKREKDFVIIEVEDDGAGIDPVTIKAKAVSLGLINEKDALTLSDKEAIMLITMSRFTTAEKADEVSGRGVGLDVVKSKVESFSGKLLIESKYNHYTKFVLSLPVTTSILQVILMDVYKEVYAVPLIYVKKIVSVSSNELNNKSINVDNENIPLIKLKDVMNVSSNGDKNNDRIEVVIVESRNKKAALLGTKLSTREKIVIKSLSKSFRLNKDIMGATILPNGKVVFILDVGEIITTY